MKTALVDGEKLGLPKEGRTCKKAKKENPTGVWGAMRLIWKDENVEIEQELEEVRTAWGQIVGLFELCVIGGGN